MSKAYWEIGPPMAFLDKPEMTLEEKRLFRYGLQDYMEVEFQFSRHIGKRVLEIGCGAGIDACEFARYGAHVIATDFAKNCVYITRNHFEEGGLEGKFVVCDGAHLPLRNNSVDIVYAFGVIQHMPLLFPPLGEIHRVLSHGGMFLGMVYNRNSLLYGFSKSMNISSERRKNVPIVKAFTPDFIKDLFENFFHDVYVRTRYNVVDLPDKRKVKFWLESAEEEKYGWHIIVEGIKR